MPFPAPTIKIQKRKILKCALHRPEEIVFFFVLFFVHLSPCGNPWPGNGRIRDRDPKQPIVLLISKQILSAGGRRGEGGGLLHGAGHATCRFVSDQSCQYVLMNLSQMQISWIFMG